MESRAASRLSPVEHAELSRSDLSDWFNPFLTKFADEARRCGGEVVVTRTDGVVTGLQVSDPVERIASVFSRSRAVVGEAYRTRGSYGLFAEQALSASAESLDVFATQTGPAPPHRFRHRVRAFERTDRRSVVDLMREVDGPVNELWFEGLPTADEAGFVVEMDDRLAGFGWASRAGSHVRLHSLTVRAPYRRLGIGTDLLFARLIWASRAGASQVLSEISRRNPASQTVALRGGMRPVGQMYFHRAA